MISNNMIKKETRGNIVTSHLRMMLKNGMEKECLLVTLRQDA
jgi:hypothetical protein